MAGPVNRWSGLRHEARRRELEGDLEGELMPDHDQVEIKVNVAGELDPLVRDLQLRDGTPRQIFFYEDLTPGLASRHPLLDAGVVLRLRSDRKGVNSTVKLRPCRRSQLVSPWEVDAAVEDEWEYRIEADWSGHRH